MIRVAHDLDKPVLVRGLSTELLFAMTVIDQLLGKKFGADFVITSCTELWRSHSWGSEHWKGDGVDHRTKTIHPGLPHRRALLEQFEQEVHRSLGGGFPKLEFDYLIEDINGPNEHGHLEFDPKRIPISIDLGGLHV